MLVCRFSRTRKYFILEIYHMGVTRRLSNAKIGQYLVVLGLLNQSCNRKHVSPARFLV